MANISAQIKTIKNATHDEELREAIAEALTVLADADQSNAVDNLKETLMSLSEKLNTKADASDVSKVRLTSKEVATLNELKDTINEITKQMTLKASTGQLRQLQTEVDAKANKSEVDKSLALKADASNVNKLTNKLDAKADSTEMARALSLKADTKTVADLAKKVDLKADAESVSGLEFKMNSSGINSKSLKAAPLSVEALGTEEGQKAIKAAVEQYATEELVTLLRSYTNEQLNLKASQHDFDLIVGSGFQGWTITDYIIRIREDYNEALATMATKAEAEELARDTIESAGKIIKIGGTIDDDTKLYFNSNGLENGEDIILVEQDDLEDALAKYDKYHTYTVKSTFEVGTLDEHGWNEDNDLIARSASYLGARDFMMTLPTAFTMQVVSYDKYKLRLGESEWMTGSISFDADRLTGAEYIKLLVKRVDEAEIADDITTLSNLEINMFGTDWTGENLQTAIDITPVNAVKARTSTLENKTSILENKVSVLEDNTAAADADISTIFDRISMINSSLEMRPNRVELGEDNILYFYCDDVMLFSAGPFVSGSGEWSGGGGGGGGATTNAVMDAKNTSGFITTDLAKDEKITLSFTWSSVEDEMPTGDGSMTVYVNGTTRITKGISQGTVTFDPSKWFQVGRNEVYVMIEDTYSQRRYIKITVNVIDLSVRVNVDTSTPYEGSFNIGIIPTGEVEKTIHTSVDGTELETDITTLSDRTISKTIPALSHGPHTIEVWVTAEVNGDELESSHVINEVIVLEAGDTTPIITTSSESTIEVAQYTNVNILFRVYDPTSLTTRIDRKVNGVSIGEITVDRNEQNWAYRAMETGAITLTISCKNVTKTFNITVTASDANIGAVEDGLKLYLTAEGRSNGEDNPGVWNYEDINATMTGFDFVSNGWMQDSDGNSVLTVSGGARVIIPYLMFKDDARTNGMTIEVEFSTRNVRNYDTAIFTCMSANRGINISAQKATLRSEQIEINAPFKEDEHVRLSFVIEKRSDDRLVSTFINGDWSGVLQYPDGDDFSQITPVGITIGSDNCTVDIYCIRVYNFNLSRQQILGNYIADRQDVDEMLRLYDDNNIFNASGKIEISMLPNYLPYMIINTQGTHLPKYKGDKTIVSGRYVNPLDKSKSFEFTNAQANVQGTSSQYYARKNFKIKFNGGFVINGVQQSKYAMNDKAIPVKTFTFKKDVASSEGANNVELVRLYDKICPYKTPAQEENENVRQGIDGFPIVIFEDNGDSVEFIGKYNFNNDKGTEDVFGFVDGDESWEVLNNTSNRVLFKDNNFSDGTWLKDFEARFPDTDPAYTDYTQLKELIDFVMSCDPDTATNEAIEPETIHYKKYTWDSDTAVVLSTAIVDETFTTDSPEYRIAKFQTMASNYFEHDSMIFYYLFTEIFLMVDSRAKNMFPSFIGASAINA